MKKPAHLILAGLMLMLPSFAFAQTIKSIQHNSTTRLYKEYVPASYNGTVAVPLVIAMHGLGDTITNFSNTGFHILGEIDNFITVYPQGMAGFVGTAWNAGIQYYGIDLNGTVDDVGFINALLDTLMAEYNIDITKVYATGFSMGGFMANRLACVSAQRFAAVASAAGTRGNMITNCNPWRKVPYCHLHGNADQTVLYTGTPFGMDAPDLVQWWVTFNQCDPTPITTAMPDNAADNITVTHYEFTNGVDNSSVEFYMADGADHAWLYEPVNDVTYTILIWNFLKKHTLTNLSIPNENNLPELVVYPSITDNLIHVEMLNGIIISEINIFNTNGAKVLVTNPQAESTTISVSHLPQGTYIIQTKGSNGSSIIGKIVVHR